MIITFASAKSFDADGRLLVSETLQHAGCQRVERLPSADALLIMDFGRASVTDK
jgi:hypothetical protein